MKVYLSEGIKDYYFNKDSYYSMINIEQFFSYFFPIKKKYTLSSFEESDIYFWSMKLTDNSKLKKNKINVIICIENINYWAKTMKKIDWPGYLHYGKYNEYNDDKIDIYIYNHIDNLIINKNYIAIPMAYLYINYFLMNNYKIKPTKMISFNKKKFCLVINKSNLNKDIISIIKKLEKIAPINHIKEYNDMISKKSCYHSQELIDVFHQFKFILCIENSYDNSYFTEKIFNCFLAKSIPLYLGCYNIQNFINPLSFIDLRKNNFIELIKNINSSEQLYNTYIHSDIIVSSYNNKQFYNHYLNKIESKLSQI